MTLPIEEKNAIIEYRIEKAMQTLKEAKDNASLGNWSLAANRLYYATFYMAIAINLNNGDSAKSHAGTYSMFNKNYIATGILSKDESRLYRQLFTMRQSGDYDDLFDWDEEDVIPLIPRTELLIQRMIALIRK